MILGSEVGDEVVEGSHGNVSSSDFHIFVGHGGNEDGEDFLDTCATLTGRVKVIAVRNYFLQIIGTIVDSKKVVGKFGEKFGDFFVSGIFKSFVSDNKGGLHEVVANVGKHLFHEIFVGSGDHSFVFFIDHVWVRGQSNFVATITSFTDKYTAIVLHSPVLIVFVQGILDNSLHIGSRIVHHRHRQTNRLIIIETDRIEKSSEYLLDGDLVDERFICF